MMAGPAAFGDADLDADLAAIIGPWPEPRTRRSARRPGADSAGLLPRLIASQNASMATVVALAFALVGGGAYVLRDRAPAERPGQREIARTRPSAVATAPMRTDDRTSVAVRSDHAAASEPAIDDGAPVKAADQRLASSPPSPAARPSQAPVRAEARHLPRARPAADRETLASATPRRAPGAPPSPGEPVRLAMVPPPAQPLPPGEPVTPRPERVGGETAPRVIASDTAVEARRARRDSIHSMRALRRQ